MGIERMEHVGIVVEDLDAAIEYFAELGLEPSGRGQVEGDWVGRIIGLEDVKAEMAMMRAPEGPTEVELVKFHAPPAKTGDSAAPANALGIRHVTFLVDDIHAVVDGLEARGAELVGELVRYEDVYELCYVRGPEGIIVELAEKLS